MLSKYGLAATMAGVTAGIGNISCSKEFRKLFNLETKKIFTGRKKSKQAQYKMVGTYSVDAIKDENVAQKIVKICQRPIKGKISKKLASLNTGETVYEFMPERLLTKNIKNYKAFVELAGVQNLFDLYNQMKKEKQSGNI